MLRGRYSVWWRARLSFSGAARCPPPDHVATAIRECGSSLIQSRKLSRPSDAARPTVSAFVFRRTLPPPSHTAGLQAKSPVEYRSGGFDGTNREHTRKPRGLRGGRGTGGGPDGARGRRRRGVSTCLSRHVPGSTGGHSSCAGTGRPRPSTLAFVCVGCRSVGFRNLACSHSQTQSDSTCIHTDTDTSVCTRTFCTGHGR